MSNCRPAGQRVQNVSTGSELIKQCQFMRSVFTNTQERLNIASSDEEWREILQGLGAAALSEHAEWILVNRERQPEPAGL